MGYSRVTYIRNNYTWFDTTVTPTPNSKIEIEFEIVTQRSNQNNGVMGEWADGYNQQTTFGFNANNGRRNFSYYVGTKYKDYAGSFTIGDRYRNSLNKSQFIINDLTTSTSSTTNISGANLVANNYPIYIGTLYHTGADLQQSSDIKIYESWIYDGETLVGHFLPYKDNETGYGVLYDTVSNRYISGVIASAVTVGDPVFGPDTDSLTFDQTGGTESITLTADSPWTATSSNWITLSQYSGETGGLITATVGNNTFGVKQGTITFTDGDNSATVAVTQNGDTNLILKNLYRNGTYIKQMFRNGEKIYQVLTKSD